MKYHNPAVRCSAEIITIGNELLRGSTLNTNALYLGHRLTDLGFEVQYQTSCTDDLSDIQEQLGQAILRSALIIVTGGLGPTPDDLTRQAVADYLKVPLLFNPSQYREIEKHYRRYGKKIPSIVRLEACFPKSSVPLINRHGIALGFYFKHHGAMIVVLPGVPSELRKMFQELVDPLLKKKFKGCSAKSKLVIKMCGVSEPEVMRKLGKKFFQRPFEFGIYPDAGEVAIRIYASSKKTTDSLKKMAIKSLGKSIYAFEEMTLAEAVSRLLMDQKATLSCAESCTGGLLLSELTRIPGASRFLLGGIVAYSNQVKVEMLGVPAQMLNRNGAVSPETAKAMALGIVTRFKSDYGIAITGIAGPGGATPTKPLGTVWIAVADGKKTNVNRYLFWGDREQIQKKAMKKALESLWRLLVQKK